MATFRRFGDCLVICAIVGLFAVLAPSKALAASSITVVPGASGSGTQDANLLADGQILFADPDLGGNTLSTGALTSVPAFSNIVVQALTISFTDLGGTLTLQTTNPNSVTFSTATGGGTTITFANTSNTLATSDGSINFIGNTGLTLANLNSAGGDITITADNMNLARPINAGTGIANLRPLTNAQAIDLGGIDAVGTLGLTDAELGQVTARILRIGHTNVFGGVNISSAITRHAGYDTMTVELGSSISQTAPLSVANLNISTTTGDITLTNAGNDVDTLAGSGSGGANVRYVDANDLIVGNVAGNTGVDANNDLTIVTGGKLTINEKLHAFNTFVGLSVGDTASQGASGQILAPGLRLLGAGPYQLNSVTNGVGTIAANVTGQVSYVDADGLSIGTVNGTVGITTANNTLTVTTQAGDLIVSNNIATGLSQSFLSSGSTLASPDHILTNNAAITGDEVHLKADRMDLNGGTINVGANLASLSVFSANRPLNLDNTAGDPIGEMRLSQTELDTITSGTLRVGIETNGGNTTVKSTITRNTLWLGSAAAITQLAGSALVVTNLAATAGQGVDLTDPGNLVSQIAGQVTASGGAFRLKSALSILTVGTVAGFAGITTNGGAVDPVENTFAVFNPGSPGTLIVNQPITTSGGSITLFADNMTLNAAVNAGAGIVWLDVELLPRPITLGTKPGTTLGLLQSDFNQVTASIQRVGDELLDTGGLTITSAITGPTAAPGTWHSLDLRQKANIGGAGGSLTVTNLLITDGTAIARTWTMNPTSVQESPNPAIPFTGVTALTVIGGSASDTFNVTPGVSTVMFIDGKGPAPPTPPGDTLNINTAGVSGMVLTKTSGPSGLDGNYIFGNRQEVAFSRIETLNPSCASAVVMTCPGSLTKFTDPGQKTATVNPGVPAVTDECGSASVTGVRSDGKPLNAPYPIGATIITWTATGTFNNTASCSQTIMVLPPSGQRRHP